MEKVKRGLVQSFVAVGVGVVLCLFPPARLLAQQPARGMAVFDDVMEWLEPLILEETSEALNAQPRLAVDPELGFLVSDRQAAQVRVYDSSGGLRLYFGHEGDGPGEFRNLRGVTRLPSGRFATVDFEGRVAVWSEEGQLLDDIRNPSLTGAMGVAALDATQLAVVRAPFLASGGSLDMPVVHVLDLENRSIPSEFFSFPLTAENFHTASTVEGEVATNLGPRVGLTWTVFDSLWVVDLERRTLTDAMRLESTSLMANSPQVDRRQDRGGFVEWMLNTTFTGAAYPLRDGGWLVSLFKRRARQGPSFGLLRVDEGGRRVWEVGESPRLVAVDPSTEVLFFADSTGLQPNRFNRARLRNQ